MQALFKKLWILLLLTPLTVLAADDGFVFEGNILDPAGNIITTPVDIRAEILGQSSCVLYSRDYLTVDPSDDTGYFLITVDASGAVYSNGPTTFAGVFGSGNFCSTTHTSASPRSLRLSISAAGAGTYETLTLIPIKSVPFAIKAKEAYALNPETNQSFNNLKITDLATPTNAQDAATKAYVDSLAVAAPVDASYTAKGIVQFDANVATSGISVTSGVAKLATTGVVAGTYGSATVVPAISVDSFGRITAVTATTISGIAPSGTAGGDLGGTYPNPTVNNIRGQNVNTTGVGNTSILQHNGTEWRIQNVPTCTAAQNLSFNGTAFLCDTDTAGLDTSGFAGKRVLATNGVGAVEDFSCPNGNVIGFDVTGNMCQSYTSGATANSLVARDGSAGISVGRVNVSDTYVGQILPPLTATSSFRLPSGNGNAGNFLSTDGAGTTAWVAGASDETDLRIFKVYPTKVGSTNISSIGAAATYNGLTSSAYVGGKVAFFVNGSTTPGGLLLADAVTQRSLLPSFSAIFVGHQGGTFTGQFQINAGFIPETAIATCGTESYCGTTVAGAYFKVLHPDDARWQCITCDGSACNTIDSGVTYSGNASKRFQIKMDLSNAYFYIDNNLVCTSNTNLPGNSTAMGGGIIGRRVSGSSSLDFGIGTINIKTP